MDLEKLTDFMVKGLAKKPDLVSVKLFEDEDLITIEVLVSKDDIGIVLGHDGVNAKAIRTIVQSSSLAKLGKPAKINIETF